MRPLRLKTFTIQFWVISCLLLLTSCGQTPSDTTLAPTAPFAFSWENLAATDTEERQSIESGCSKKIQQLGELIPTTNRQEILDLCMGEKYHQTFLSSDSYPDFFRDGEISATIRGWDEPVAYEYSYLHTMVGDPENTELRKKRIKHAHKIKNTLSAKYGAPLASGYFQQMMSPGFFPTEGKNQPCHLWIRDEVGILLCTNRVILIDGIEMSLSYYKLDRIPFGEALKCMARTKNAYLCADEINAGNNSRSNEPPLFLDILADWLDPKDFRACKSTSLEPLETAWELSKKTEIEIKKFAEQYSADELMKYATKNYNGLPWSDSRSDKDKTTLFLFKIAMDQNNAAAMNEIGAILLYCHHNVRQDTSQAQTLLREAANRGNILAMTTVARMHLDGAIDIHPNLPEASWWLEKCSERNADECVKLSRAIKELTSVTNN